MPEGSARDGIGHGPPPSRSPGRARLAVALVCACASAVFAADAPGPERTTELVRMVRQDCGSCHGMRLTGGLGPALTPDALRGRPADGLTVTVLYGRPGSAMPPWRQFVSEAEAGWIVEQLRQGFPDAR